MGKTVVEHIYSLANDEENILISYPKFEAETKNREAAQDIFDVFLKHGYTFGQAFEMAQCFSLFFESIMDKHPGFIQKKLSTYGLYSFSEEITDSLLKRKREQSAGSGTK